jgi:uncharacterized protein YegL
LLIDFRAPIDLVTVVDTSGSMSGTSLELVKTTLHFIVKEFNHKDKLSIVSFNSSITTPLKFTAMDAVGKVVSFLYPFLKYFSAKCN